MPRSKSLSDIEEVLRGHSELQLAILFGSLAVGKETMRSDVDVAVDLGHRLTAPERIALVEQLAERIGRPVDLVDLRTAGEPLLGQILKKGIRIFGSNTAYAGAIRRHLFETADFLPYRKRILEARRQAWIGN